MSPRQRGSMIPDHVRTVLQEIRARGGDAPPGYHGGAIFHPHVPGTDRGPERLIIDQVTRMAFYTSDHYVSFEAVGE
jgi:hypothetical protein